MWFVLRDGRLDGLKFRRQVPVGNAILDFVCFEQHLVVELDGSQHLESKADEKRDAELRRRGFRVLRFWNNDVLSNTEGVLEAIRSAIASHP